MKISRIAIWLATATALVVPREAHAQGEVAARTVERVSDRSAEASPSQADLLHSAVQGRLDRPSVPRWEGWPRSDEATADHGAGELDEDVGYVVTPEPATLVLLATGLLLLMTIPVARRLRARI